MRQAQVHRDRACKSDRTHTKRTDDDNAPKASSRSDDRGAVVMSRSPLPAGHRRASHPSVAASLSPDPLFQAKKLRQTGARYNQVSERPAVENV
jgi:hypothetical protein